MKVRVKVGDDIKSQVAFWGSASRLKAYVGGIGSGKTFAGGVELLRMPAGSRVMVVAPTYRMLTDATMANFWEAFGATVATHNKSSFTSTLHNGTEVLWRSADRPDSLRGPNINGLWGDEWAFVDPASHRICMGRVRLNPARVWLTTTPDGLNWLYNELMVRGPQLGWDVHFGSTLQNPHLAQVYLDTISVQYADDPLFAAQELEGKFVDLSGSKRHPALLVETVYNAGVPLSDPGEPLTAFELPERGCTYVIGADPAEGVQGGDDSAAVVMERKTGRVVATIAGEYEPKEEFPAILRDASEMYHGAPVLIERNNHGHAVIGGAARFGVALMSGDDGRLGWRTTAQSKAELHRSLHSLCLDAKATGRVILPSAVLKDQIKAIDRQTLAHPAKKKGKTKLDDLATAAALASMGRELKIGQVKSKAVEAPSVFSPLTEGSW